MKALLVSLLILVSFRASGEEPSLSTNPVRIGADSSDAEKISAYFAQQKMQCGMGSIVLVPVLGQNPSVRTALVAHQNEFDSSQAAILFDDSNLGDKRPFLFLIRREVAAPAYNPDALALLSDLEPAEAEPLVVADLQRPEPLFRRKKSYRNFYPLLYLHLPDRPIPALTDYFRQQLARPKEHFDYDVLPLVDRYGTPDLLPDVLRIYQPYAGKWACKIEESCLRFWIRCDPDAGFVALEKSLQSRETGCYRSLVARVSEGRWNQRFQSLALKRMHDPDPEIVAISINDLARLGDASVSTPVAWAYLRLVEKARHDTTFAKILAEYWTNPSTGAWFLLQDKRLQFTNEDKHQLEILQNHKPSSTP
jgi:hypothetical protein